LLGLMDKDISEWKPLIKTLDTKLIIRNSTVHQAQE